MANRMAKRGSVIITNFQLNDKVCKEFDLKWYQCWILATKLWIPEVDEVRQMQNESLAENEQYYTEIYDCDKFSLQLLADCHKWVAARQDKYNAQWAFMRVSGNMCRSLIMNHSWNLVLTRDGFWHCESMMGADRLWKHNPEENRIIFAHT